MPYESVANALQGTDTARSNLLVNGGFEIWQRGTSFTGFLFTADRWQTSPAGGSTLSVSRETTTTDGSPTAAACTAGGTVTSQQCNLQQTVEDLQIKGKTVTLSIRVRSPSVGSVRLGIYTSAWQMGTVNALSGTYETLTVTTAVPAGGTPIVVGVLFGAAGTFYIDNAMLVVGSQPSDYAPLHPADDLARCLRYYEVTSGAGNYFANMLMYTTTVCLGFHKYRAIKPVVATVTFSPTMTLQFGAGPGAMNFTPGTPALFLDGASLNGTSSGNFIGGGYGVAYFSDSTGKMVVEANP